MDRRSFLTVSVLAIAGCNQLPSTDTTSPTDTRTQPTPTTSPTATTTDSPTSSPTESPTDTATETETPTETDTETPALSPREERAAQAMDRAIEELTQAIDTYADREDGSLLDVSAATGSFPRVAVISDIANADDHIEVAESRASERQQSRLAGVVDARQFLRLCVDIQAPLIEAYEDAERGRDALDGERDSDMASANDDLRSQLRRANQAFTRLTGETSAEAVSVVPALPTTEYEGKVDQFEAEIDGLESLADFFDRLRTAVVDLNDAERFDRVESENNARTNAREAAEAFETLETELRSFATNLSESGASIERLATDLADLAAQKAEKARDIQEDNS